MKQGIDFMTAMADFDLYPDAVIWRAGAPLAVRQNGDSILLEIPFYPFELRTGLQPSIDKPTRICQFYIEAWSDQTLRITTQPGIPLDSPMIDHMQDHTLMPLYIEEQADQWLIRNERNETRAVFMQKRYPEDGWSTLISKSFDSLQGRLFPDSVDIALSAYDQFFPEKVESLPLAFLEYQIEGQRTESFLFSITSTYDEHFSGTGERFGTVDLRRTTQILENTDALGVNSRRAYKNVPFFLSSRGYGLFIHSSNHMRLSFADISSRAVQGRIDSPECDLFFFAGETPERILYQYRKITGFPPTVPAWSYGVWMSRMTYFSADEIEEIAKRMRSESYPCDVLHIDTGWFETDWVCEWKFSKERFPDPQGFMGRLKDQGFRVSLWQTPNIGKGNCLYDEAVAKRILPPIRTEKAHVDVVSDFSGQDMGGQIDFTNAEAVTWYQEKIRRLLQMGAAAIKTDFGEKILMRADFLHMDTSRLHNLYGLLYQKAAFEETVRTTGEGLIWARSGWAGCQRYPLHWGGDAAATWDGMAATLRGGLQLGLSGFGYWSHDIPGFHGLPEFMNTAPSDTLYMRWTQMGVFTSHMRYHGTSAREPWHFPRISDDIRKWFNLRYRLIPYFLEQGRICANSGYPMLRALHLMHPDDPVCWNIDDQFYCGDSFLVCPVMNDSGVRNVYLPHGSWVDFFSGERLSGGRYLMQVASPLDRLPVYCPEGARIPIYPEIVQCTDDMDWNKVTMLILVPDTNIQG